MAGRAKITYRGTSFSKPVRHSDELPVPRPPTNTPGTDPTYAPTLTETPVAKYKQDELFGLVRKLELSQRKAEILTSDLKNKGMLHPTIPVHIFRNRQERFKPYFTNNEDNTFVHCNDINGLMTEMRIEYKAEEWRIFIDSSKSSLKAVLLFVENTKAPIPIAYATGMKETYESMHLILNSVKYEEHKWRLCADLKVIALVSGLQCGWTKHACFLCNWHTRYYGNQYETHHWQLRNAAVIGELNMLHKPLIPNEKILLPPLHIKLGVMTNFVKSLPVESAAFAHLCSVFPHISYAKIKEGMFVGPDIRKLMHDDEFDNALNDLSPEHLVVWDLVKTLFNGFLGKERIESYRVLVNDLMEAFNTIGVKMSLKIHFLHHHIDVFERQIPTESDEQGERFHQICKPMDTRYKEKNLKSMIADLCWYLTSNDLN